MKYLLYVISLFSFIASIVIIPNPVGILSVLLLFTTLYNVEIKKTIYKKDYYILLLYSIKAAVPFGTAAFFVLLKKCDEGGIIGMEANLVWKRRIMPQGRLYMPWGL